MKTLYEVIGKKSSKSAKSGKDCYNYYFAGEFTEYDTENGECEGRPVVQEFCYLNFDVCIGDLVELDYEKGFQDKAVLCDITVVKPSAFRDKGAKKPETTNK